MNRLLLILFLCLMCSCDFFNKKKENSKDIFEEQLLTFNWKDVDEYPTFESCDNTSGKENKKACFENTLREVLNRNLAVHQIVVSEEINDTIQLKITIDNKGELFIDDIVTNEMTRSQIPQVDSLLIKSLDSLPKIFPAIKRNQQVKTQFIFPIVIKIE